MTDKPKPSKAPSTWRGKPGYETWGNMKPVSVQPSLGSRIGNKLFGWLTPWMK